MQDNISFKIGQFTVNTLEHSLLSNGGETELLQPKCIEVLHYLVKQYPNLVSREELINNIWRGNAYVGEKALTNAIWGIRQHLHKDKEEYIQTVRKSGYRLIQEPHIIETAQPGGIKTEEITHTTQEAVNNALSWKLIVLTVVSLCLAYLYSFSPNQVNRIIESLTSDPGRELYPAVSPDGNYLVYFWRKINETPDIYLKDLRQPDLEPEQLTFNSDTESRIVWNNLGDTLYFVQKSWNADRCNIIEYDLQSKSQQSVATCRGDVNAALSISKDSKVLAFNSVDPVNTTPGIYFLDLTQENAKPIRYSCSIECNYSDRDLIFSPDGSKYAINRRTQQYEEDIFIVDKTTNEAKQITIGQRDIVGMAWHPTENKIVYSAEKNDVRNGYMVNIDTKTIIELDVKGFSFPSFIGETTDIVFHDWQLTQFIASLSAEPDNVSIPFPLIQSEFIHSTPNYNSTVDKISYISNESGHKEVWIADWNGENRVKLTDLRNNIFYPQWSHDGQKIAFMVRHTASDKSSIKIVDVTTRAVVEVGSNEFSQMSMPTWMQDDASILVQATKVSPHSGNSENGFYSVNITTNNSELMVDSNGGYAVHTKDNNILFSDNDEAIYSLDLNTVPNQLTQLIDGNVVSSDYSWVKAPQHIYFIQNFPDHQRVQSLHVSSKEIKTLMRAPLRTIESSLPINYNDKNNTLIFTETSFPQVDIKKLTHPSLMN
jgi:Tol biopolymer transport system component